MEPKKIDQLLDEFCSIDSLEGCNVLIDEFLVYVKENPNDWKGCYYFSSLLQFLDIKKTIGFCLVSLDNFRKNYHCDSTKTQDKMYAYQLSRKAYQLALKSQICDHHQIFQDYTAFFIHQVLAFASNSMIDEVAILAYLHNKSDCGHNMSDRLTYPYLTKGAEKEIFMHIDGSKNKIDKDFLKDLQYAKEHQYERPAIWFVLDLMS